jgi:hypothetical protein
MAWSGGTFTRVGGETAWDDDRAAATNMTSALHDTHDEDLASGGIQICIARDGQNTPTADLPMNSKEFTGVGAGEDDQDYIQVAQQQDSSLIYSTVTLGSADSIVLVPTPAITAYAQGQMFIFRAAFTNATTTPLLRVNGLLPTVVDKMAGELDVGDIVSGAVHIVIYRTAGSTAFQLINPASFPT